MNRGGRLAGWVAPARVQVWWLYKTPILFGLVYLVAAVTQVPVTALPPLLARLVAAIVPVGCFACVINELSDEHDDRIAGKANTMTGRRRRYRWGWAAAAGAGVGLGLGLLRDSPQEMGLYLADVLVFLLYSLPPVRLKCHGVWGVLADASGALVIPGLWISIAVSRQGTAPLPLPVGIALVTWTLGYGMRSILKHQADDLSSDRRSGTATLGMRRGREGLERLGRLVAFPLEIGSLPVLLWAGGGWLSLGVALAYALGQVTAARKREIPLRWVDGQPGTWLLLFTASFSLVPLLLLPRLLQQSPWAWLIPPLHLLLFAPGWRAQGCFRFRGPGGALAALFA